MYLIRTKGNYTIGGRYAGGSLFEEYDPYGDGGILVPNYFKGTESGYILREAKRLHAVLYSGGCCERCGRDELLMLAHHHIDPKGIKDPKNVKIATISDICRGNAPDCSKLGLERECDKCILLCHTCHGETHCLKNSEAKDELLRLMGGFYFCMICGYESSDKNLGGLSLHHRDRSGKDFNISSIYSKKCGFKIPIEQVIAELAKCDVICNNCHSFREAHYERFTGLKPQIFKKREEWIKNQDYFVNSGERRKNPYSNKENKRHINGRGHRSDPEHNPFDSVSHDCPRDVVQRNFDIRMNDLLKRFSSK